MFSIRAESRPIMVYAEWGVFTILIVALIIMWWVLQFGFTWKAQKEQAGDYRFSVPEEVLNSLMAGTSTPQPVPAIVLKNLSSGVSAGEEVPSIPQEVLDALSR